MCLEHAAKMFTPVKNTLIQLYNKITIRFFNEVHFDNRLSVVVVVVVGGGGIFSVTSSLA